MSFSTTIATLDVPSFDTTVSDPPRIYWHNGRDQRRGAPGSFYTVATEHPEGPGAPWRCEERFRDEEGYSAEQLKLAIIAMRQQAYFKDGTGKDASWVWLPKWEQGARIYTELLCWAEGMSYPVVWVVQGLIGKAVVNRGGLLDRYRSGLLQQASRVAKRQLPLWTFWLPIVTLRDGEGQPVYQEGPQRTTITPPALHPQVQPKQSVMDRLFVGAQILQDLALVREEYDGWLRQRRGNVQAAPAVEEESSATEERPSQPAPRSVPVATDEDAIDFDEPQRRTARVVPDRNDTVQAQARRVPAGVRR